MDRESGTEKSNWKNIFSRKNAGSMPRLIINSNKHTIQ